jgi:hypothetical protein
VQLRFVTFKPEKLPEIFNFNESYWSVLFRAVKHKKLFRISHFTWWTDGILPSKKKLGSKMIMKPSSFYYSVHDGKNSFRIQSYDCALNKNVAVANNESCSDCRNFWRSFRNNTADKYLDASSHNKIKCNAENTCTDTAVHLMSDARRRKCDSFPKSTVLVWKSTNGILHL